MKNNLEIKNIVMFGKFKLKRRISTEDQNRLINKCNWFGPREDNLLISKVYEIRNIGEKNVHNRQKNPYVTLWCSGSIGIVGLKTTKEGDLIWDLVVKDLKKISRTLL